MKQLLSALVLMALAVPGRAADPKNVLFDDLLTVGVPVSGGPTVKLAAPLLKPGTPQNSLDEVLEKASGNKPVEYFLRRTVNAPFNLKIESVDTAAGERCGQMINLWFVAHGKLEAALKSDFIGELLVGKGKSKEGSEREGPLSPEELSKRGIRLLKTPGLAENYGQLTMELLEKVQVDGVTRSIRTKAAGSLVYAVRLDDRFKDDKEYPNRWRHVLRSAAGNDGLGPPHPYSGLAGYVIVTELPEKKDALLVEMHFLLAEQPEWFGGYNLLRSKMPIKIQDNVRTFRRKLTRE